MPDVGDLIKITWKETSYGFGYVARTKVGREMTGIFLGRSDHSKRFNWPGSNYGGFTHWVLWDVLNNKEHHQPIFRMDKIEILVPVGETEDA